MLSRDQRWSVCCQVGVSQSLSCCQLLVLQGKAECRAAICPCLLPAELCQHKSQLMHVAEVVIATSMVEHDCVRPWPPSDQSFRLIVVGSLLAGPQSDKSTRTAALLKALAFQHTFGALMSWCTAFLLSKVCRPLQMLRAAFFSSCTLHATSCKDSQQLSWLVQMQYHSNRCRNATQCSLDLPKIAAFNSKTTEQEHGRIGRSWCNGDILFQSVSSGQRDCGSRTSSVTGGRSSRLSPSMFM